MAGSELKKCLDELIDVNYVKLGLPEQPDVVEETLISIDSTSIFQRRAK